MLRRPPIWVAELTAQFWAVVGSPPPFPRDLRSVLCWLPSLHLLAVPNLTLATAVRHFNQHHIPYPELSYDRPLAGCFGAWKGIGVILLDASLELAELRFTLAHEVAHFLRDYEDPRRKVEKRLGRSALEVLDGLRPATTSERFAGVLRGVTIGCHRHFLDRDRWGRTTTTEASEAEEAADQLAYELLAPFAAVSAVASFNPGAILSHLTSHFGLPPTEAAKYATILVR